ncbi:MAG: EcsC family protein [Marmoricola sp.]
MGIGSRIGKTLGPRAAQAAPGLTTAFVHEALERAINGVGPLPGAAKAAEKQLAEQHGDVDKAVHEMVENHVRWAGAQGFVTNIGGLVTLAATIPTNIAGLALLQCRMVAGVAHLRGYDLADPRVHNAILAAILGEENVLALIRKKQLPGTPMAIATAPAHDPDLDKVMAAQVATAMVTKVAGKRLAIVAGKRVPVVGGMVGAGTDAYSTWKIGRYVSREFLPRRAR